MAWASTGWLPRFQVHALACMDRALAVERQVVGEFLHQDMCQQTGAGPTLTFCRLRILYNAGKLSCAAWRLMKLPLSAIPM